VAQETTILFRTRPGAFSPFEGFKKGMDKAGGEKKPSDPPALFFSPSGSRMTLSYRL